MRIPNGASSGNPGQNLWLSYLQSIQRSFEQKKRNESSVPSKPAHVIPPNRVDRLDGDTLQEHFLQVIRSKIGQALDGFGPDQVVRKLASKYSAEIEAVVHAFLLFYSFPQRYGDHLVNLRFAASKLPAQIIILYITLKVAVPYAIAKAYTYGVEHGWMFNKRWAWKVINLLEICTKLLSIAEFILIHASARYRSIIDWLFGLRLEYGDKRLEKVRNAPVALRTILFGEIISLYSFYSPIASDLYAAIVKGLSVILTRLKKSIYGTEPQKTLIKEKPSEAEIHHCALCLDEPIQVPVMLIPCRHKFCYYCIMQEIAAIAFQDKSEDQRSHLWDDVISMRHGSIYVDPQYTPKCPHCAERFLSLSRC